MKGKLSYKEGDWFAVPLRSGGYAMGLVARARKRGKVLFGYFFGPRLDRPARLDDVARFGPRDAVFIGRFGDLSLMTGEWLIVGQAGVWNRAAWPMPPLVRVDLVSGKPWKIHYSEDDPSVSVSEAPSEEAERDALPQDGLWGAGAVEIRLTKLLSVKSAEMGCT